MTFVPIPQVSTRRLLPGRPPQAPRAQAPALAWSPDSFYRPAPLTPLPVTGISGLSIVPARAGPDIDAARARDCLSRSMPVFNSQRGVGSALGPLLDATTAVRPMYVRPGSQQPLADIYAATPDGVTGRLGGINAGVPLHRTPTGLVGVGGFFDSGQAIINVHSEGGGISHGGTVAIGDGFMNFGSTNSVLHGTSLTTYGASIMGWRDFIGLNATWLHLDTATGQLFLVGAAVAQLADRAINDLGAVSDTSLAATLAKYRGLPASTPMHGVEVRHARGIVASLRGMAGHLLFGAQGRIAFSRSHDTGYSAMLPHQVARDILLERGGARRFFRDKGRALGLCRDPLRMPSLTHPDTLPVGDSMSAICVGAWVMAVFAGNLAAWAGFQAIIKGDVAIRVRKTALHCVEVSYTPIKVRSVAAVVTSAFGLQATLDRSPARSLRQVFTFDLQHASAREAYQQALKGHLPGGLATRATRYPGTNTSASSLQEALCEEAASLPEGVTRIYAHAFRAVQKRAGGGLHLYLIPRFALPRGFEPGWMRHRIALRETEMAANALSTVRTESRSTEARSEQGWRGLRSRRATAVACWANQGRGEHFASLMLRATLSQGRLGYRGLDSEILAWVRKHFAISLAPHAPLKGRRAWQLEINRPLKRGDIARLAGQDGASQEPMAHVQHRLQLLSVAKQAHIPASRLERFEQDIAAAATLEGRVICIQRFSQRWGLRAMAALHAMLGDSREKLGLQLSEASYETSLRDIQRAALKYEETTVASKKTPTQQLDETRRALASICQTHADMSANPLLPRAQLTTWRMQLHDAQHTLTQAQARLSAHARA